MKNELKWYERSWQGVGVCISRTSSSGSLGHTKDSSSLSTGIKICYFTLIRGGKCS